jgi:hypothetical protein
MKKYSVLVLVVVQVSGNTAIDIVKVAQQLVVMEM